jgi:predicted transposase/invertase (TIGR01784 family)
VESVEILNSEIVSEIEGGRSVRLDITAKTGDGKLLDIEIQKEVENDMSDRILYYFCEMFARQLSKGDSFSKLKKCICIVILEKGLCNDELYHHTAKLTVEETGKLFSDKIEIYMIELSKIERILDNDPITRWGEFLKEPPSRVVGELGEKEGIIKEAIDLFDAISSDPQMRELIRMREQGEMDVNSRIANGEARGRIDGIIETARNLINLGMPKDIISKATGLPISEIEAL